MLLFMDGCAHYDTSRLGLKYTTVNLGSTGNTTVFAVTAEGRFGNCIKRTVLSNFGDGYLGVAPLMTRSGIWAPTTSGVCGFAIKVDDLSKISVGGAGQTGEFFAVWEGSGAHLFVGLNPDGTFTVRQAATFAGTILQQSTEGLQNGAWAFVEFKWLLAYSATGSFSIRVNGVTVLTVSGVVTAGSYGVSTIGVWNAVHLLGTHPTATTPYLTMRSCDFYLADTASADSDDVSDFLGDGTIRTIMPNGVGASTGWTPASGTNWDAVNDRPAPDDDGTYVSSLTPGTLDTYQFEDVPAGAEVKGVHVNILARKETEGGAAVAPVVHQGSTDYVGPTQGVSNILYDRYITQPYDLNPATLNKFTAGEINAGEFGVKKVI